MKASNILQKLIDGAFSFIPQKKPTAKLASQCKIIAHRGAWSKKLRENTMEAFKACLGTGIWGLEFDVRWTNDNVPVIHHDENTRRVFKKNIFIADISFDELRKEIPQIPSLEEVVSVFSKKIHLMLELKTKPTKEQLQILQKNLSHLSPATDYHFMALNLSILEELGCFDHQCLITVGRADLAAIYKASLNQKLGGVAGHYLLLNNKMLSEQKSLGRITGTGFPSNKNTLYREINRGIPWIFTNRALELQRVLDSLSNK